ncbi:MAG: hypothetical protein J2P59_11660, partial [Acidimicrobiales bacterium]|nr:hypothetical protein [Acidimicrobiales bacterium]
MSADEQPMATPRTLSVVGSTGSIGLQALEVARRHPERYRVVALGAHRQVEVLAAQAAEFRPAKVAVGDPSLASALAGLVPKGTEVLAGPDSMAEVSTCAEVVLNAVVG